MIILSTKWIRITLPSLCASESSAMLALLALGEGQRSFFQALAWARHFARLSRKRLNRLIERGLVRVTISQDLRPGIGVVQAISKKKVTKEWRKHKDGAKYSKYLAIPPGQLAYLATLPNRAGALWLFLRTSPYPTSVRALSRRLGWTREAIRNALETLRAHGLIETEWDYEEKWFRFSLSTPPEIPVPEVPRVPAGAFVRSVKPGFSRQLRVAKRVGQILRDMEKVVQVSPLWLQVFGYRSLRVPDQFWRKKIRLIPMMIALGELRPPMADPLPVKEFVERCDQYPSARTPTTVLYAAYLTICVTLRRLPVTLTSFGRALSGLGYEKKRLGWAGIAPPATGYAVPCESTEPPVQELLPARCFTAPPGEVVKNDWGWEIGEWEDDPLEDEPGGWDEEGGWWPDEWEWETDDGEEEEGFGPDEGLGPDKEDGEAFLPQAPNPDDGPKPGPKEVGPVSMDDLIAELRARFRPRGGYSHGPPLRGIEL